MGVALPERLKETLDAKSFAHVATVGADGHPHNSVMWITRDGDHLVVNTAAGRVKWHNMRRDPRVSISVSPPDDTTLNYSIKGRVVEMRTEDGVEMIDALSQKYIGVEKFPWLGEGDVRVTIVIEALAVASNQ
jgi:PPOX class probable F420-dependent enzyme